MAQSINKLTARQVVTLTEPGRHGDGNGLYLVVDKSGSKRWVYLFRWKDDPGETGRGRLREMGLGSFNVVSLAEARAAAQEARKAVAQRIDPIAARRSVVPQKSAPAFGEIADALHKSLAPGFRNSKHAAQWAVTVGVIEYDREKVRIPKLAHDAHMKALKALRAKPIDLVETADVLSVLQPIWNEAPETASRIRGRIEKILDAAAVQGHRKGDNVARLRGHLDHVLPKRSQLSKGHHAALPYQQVPDVIARLRAVGGVSAACLEFIILTACRTGEALGARWSEVDLDKKVWSIPADRMKAAKPHRIPLSDRPLAILAAMRSIRQTDEGYLFPGQKQGKPLSQMAALMALRRLEMGEATTHGFRSSFRDWAGEETDYAREIVEMALAHSIGSSVEAAYRRQDGLEKRRTLMKEWGDYCEPKAGRR